MDAVFENLRNDFSRLIDEIYEYSKDLPLSEQEKITFWNSFEYYKDNENIYGKCKSLVDVARKLENIVDVYKMFDTEECKLITAYCKYLHWFDDYTIMRAKFKLKDFDKYKKVYYADIEAMNEIIKEAYERGDRDCFYDLRNDLYNMTGQYGNRESFETLRLMMEYTSLLSCMWGLEKSNKTYITFNTFKEDYEGDRKIYYRYKMN